MTLPFLLLGYLLDRRFRVFVKITTLLRKLYNNNIFKRIFLMTGES